MSLYTLARSVEATALRLLEEYKPGRRLQTNVEFYTALLLHGLGFEVPLFTPTFAIGRVSGWIAHVLEQRKTARLIRPSSEYVGERGRVYRDRESVVTGRVSTRREASSSISAGTNRRESAGHVAASSQGSQ